MKLNRIACVIYTVTCFVSCNSAFPQTPGKPAFEVASVKPLPSMQVLTEEIQTGKRSLASIKTVMNSARVDIGASPMMELLTVAYSVKPYQITGPEWLYSQIFEIHAKLPEGASKDQIPEMLQSLLSDRFKLVAHKENKEQPVYALIVSKNGHKLNRAIADSDASSPGDDRANVPSTKDSADKGTVVSADRQTPEIAVKQEGNGMVMSINKNTQMRMIIGEGGAIQMEYSNSNIKMQEFVHLLSMLVDRPVVDMTELKGSYQVTLEIPRDEMMNMARKMMPDLPMGAGNAGGLVGSAPGTGLSASEPSGGGIFQAVQKLGLKLDSRKAPVETVVIDSIEKTPAEN